MGFMGTFSMVNYDDKRVSLPNFSSDTQISTLGPNTVENGWSISQFNLHYVSIANKGFARKQTKSKPDLGLGLAPGLGITLPASRFFEKIVDNTFMYEIIT